MPTVPIERDKVSSMASVACVEIVVGLLREREIDHPDRKPTVELVYEKSDSSLGMKRTFALENGVYEGEVSGVVVALTGSQAVT